MTLPGIAIVHNAAGLMELHMVHMQVLNPKTSNGYLAKSW